MEGPLDTCFECGKTFVEDLQPIYRIEFDGYKKYCSECAPIILGKRTIILGMRTRKAPERYSPEESPEDDFEDNGIEEPFTPLDNKYVRCRFCGLVVLRRSSKRIYQKGHRKIICTRCFIGLARNPSH